MTTSNCCSNNYGPRQHREKLVPTVIKSCLEQKPIPVYGNGSNIRDWLYVDDHCNAIWKILSAGVVGETYNVGGNYEIDNLSLVKMICAIMDKKFPENSSHERLITFVVDRLGHDWRYAIDGKKIRDQIGWVAQKNIHDGLELTISYYLNL